MNMKKALLLLALLLCLTGLSAAEEKSPVLLYTVYQQEGWGDRLQVGFVDKKGNGWLLTGDASSLSWPRDPGEQLRFLASCESMEHRFTLSHDDLFSLESLIYPVEIPETGPVNAGLDFGTENSYAVRYEDGSPVPVLLGTSGDRFYENTQPDAQALYRFLREKFPEVTSYAGMEGIGPMGFSPVPMSLFCKGGTQDLSDAVVTRIYTDCEAGYFPNSVTEEEREYILQMLRTAMVTGKANNVFVTGGTNIFVFSDADGRQRFSFELYQGLLVCNDGMYTLSVPEDAP